MASNIRIRESFKKGTFEWEKLDGQIPTVKNCKLEEMRMGEENREIPKLRELLIRKKRAGFNKFLNPSLKFKQRFSHFKTTNNGRFKL